MANNEKKIQEIKKRFTKIDLFMLYLIAKSFKDAGDNKPEIDGSNYDLLNEELANIYATTTDEAIKSVNEAYSEGYNKDNNRDRKHAAILSAALLLGSASHMNIKGQESLLNTQKVVQRATEGSLIQFRQAQYSSVNKAVYAYNSGGMTWLQAKQKAINDLADSGITFFVDKAGRKWSIDSYVEMGVRTGIAHASRAGFDESMGIRGIDLVYVSSHFGACPLCVPWEGQILSRSGTSSNYPSVDEALSGGLFHPNCGHRFLEFIEGYSKPVKYDSEENTKLYENRQRQRQMENTLRKWKRREAGAIIPEERQRSKAYVKKWSNELKVFTENNQLARKRYRESI